MTGDPFEGTWKAKNDKSQWDPALHAGAGVPAVRSDRDGIPAGRVRDQGRPGGRRTPNVDHRGRPAPPAGRSQRPADSGRSAGRDGVWQPARSADDRRRASKSTARCWGRESTGLGRRQDAHGDDRRDGPQGAVQGRRGVRARRAGSLPAHELTRAQKPLGGAQRRSAIVYGTLSARCRVPSRSCGSTSTTPSVSRCARLQRRAFHHLCDPSHPRLHVRLKERFDLVDVGGGILAEQFHSLRESRRALR